MGNIFNVTVDEKNVSFNLILGEKGSKFCNVRAKMYEKYDTCSICKSLIMKDSIYLIYNNFQLFPNTICHKNCVDSFVSLKDVAKYLRNDYEKYLEYKYWDKS